MANSKITKNQISKFLAEVSRDYSVYAPRVENGIVTFGRITSGEEPMLDYRNSTISAKELFLPKAEVVYEFDGQKFVNETLSDEKLVIFGMRPCDCRALTLLDMVFDTELIKDPFYVNRRQNTIVIALGCDKPLSSCFCTAVGGDPYGQEGADILMGEAGDSLLAKAITPKGKDFLTQYGKFFSAKASGDWDKQAKEARSKIESKFKLKLDNAKSRLDDRFENDIWETVSQKCLGCGVCSYLCPTCYCFDLVNERTSTGTRKVRKWDCCMFSLFTHHASGHNPRPVNAPRLRQKIMHKFSYYPEQYGINGCVGCGRCVRSCPANLDIRQLIEKITAAPNPTTEEKAKLS
ncbi:MAG: 4Fe-4S dicluster domain-containing protein [Planctomycetota bacterium]|jgi:ferredoxin